MNDFIFKFLFYQLLNNDCHNFQRFDVILNISNEDNIIGLELQYVILDI